MKTSDLGIVDIVVDKSQEARNLIPKNSHSKSSIEDKVEKQTEKTQHTFLDNMDALACGVEARFEESTGYSRRVAETTADIARELGIPEDEIEKWASFRLTRLAHDTERFRKINSVLERLHGNSLDV